MRIDLEAEYNNRARVPEHPEIIAGWARDAAAYRKTHPKALQSRIDYGPTERQYIDVFAPERPSADTLPVLFIHGGYWQGLDPSFFSHMAKGLNAHGVTVGVVGYDLCPDVTIQEIIRQMRTAVHWMGRKFGRPLIVAGHSAGGHLAACLQGTEWQEDPGPEDVRPVAGGLAISGIFELEPLVPTSINIKLGLTPETAYADSPRLWKGPDGNAFECWVGSAESSEYLRQSRTMAAVWSVYGTRTAYVEVPNANHFTVIAGLAEADSPISLRLKEMATPARIDRFEWVGQR